MHKQTKHNTTETQSNVTTTKSIKAHNFRVYRRTRTILILIFRSKTQFSSTIILLLLIFWLCVELNTFRIERQQHIGWCVYIDKRCTLNHSQRSNDLIQNETYIGEWNNFFSFVVVVFGCYSRLEYFYSTTNFKWT